MYRYGGINREQVKKVPKSFKWLVLISFSLNSMSSSFSFGVNQIIGAYLVDYFNTTQEVMNWCNNLYLICAILFSSCLNPFIIKKFGVSQIISCLFSAAGLLIISLDNLNSFKTVLSLTLMGIGESSYYQVPLHLSKIWFEPQERIMSTFIGSYINPFGILLGYSIAAYYFFEIYDQKEVNTRFRNLMSINAGFYVFVTVANFVALKKNQKIHEKLEIRENIKDSLFKVVASAESILDLCSAAFSKFPLYKVIGWSWNYTFLFNMLQYQLGQSYKDQISVTVENFQLLLYQIGSIVSAYICSLQLSKQIRKGLQPEYDKYIKFTLGIGFSGLLIQIALYDYLPPFLLAILNIFIAGTGGLYSLFLESLMEKHYPVQELTIGTILFIVASIEALIMNSILRIASFQNYGFLISCFFTIAPFCYIMVFYKTQYKRFEQEG